jgi:phosphoenolpyruvate---glycerone phosphotransferase subunit DhaL
VATKDVGTSHQELVEEKTMAVTTENILRWLENYAHVLHENSAFLTQLDAAIGDADHGSNMDRGFSAVSKKLASIEISDIGALLKTVGSTLVSTVGGASGPLYGTFFLRAGAATTGKVELTASDFTTMLAAAVEGIKTRGKAQQGEKTMLDALIPALEAAQKAQNEHIGFPQILELCSNAAEAGMKSTIPMLATKGRASYLGERSIDHQDPGATSSWLLLKALTDSYASAGGQV